MYNILQWGTCSYICHVRSIGTFILLCNLPLLNKYKKAFLSSALQAGLRFIWGGFLLHLNVLSPILLTLICMNTTTPNIMVPVKSREKYPKPQRLLFPNAISYFELSQELESNNLCHIFLGVFTIANTPWIIQMFVHQFHTVSKNKTENFEIPYHLCLLGYHLECRCGWQESRGRR